MTSFESMMDFSEFKLNSDGLIPVIVQDYKTNEVLMMAYMNEEAFDNTVKTGRMTYYSRSRQCQWVKGETSGHFQYVKSLAIDCDKDTLLAKVDQVGAACHTGNRSCFYTTIVGADYDAKNPLQVFESVYSTIEDRRIHPKEGSYTNYLFEKGRIDIPEYEKKYSILSGKINSISEELSNNKVVRIEEFKKQIPSNWKVLYEQLDQKGKQEFWHRIIKEIYLNEAFEITGFIFYI